MYHLRQEVSWQAKVVGAPADPHSLSYLRHEVRYGGGVAASVVFGEEEDLDPNGWVIMGGEEDEEEDDDEGQVKGAELE